MNQYELANAVSKVDGYFMPSAYQGIGGAGGQEAAFNIAKKETLTNLQTQMDNIQELTFEQFAEKKKLKRPEQS